MARVEGRHASREEDRPTVTSGWELEVALLLSRLRCPRVSSGSCRPVTASLRHLVSCGN